MGNNQSVFGEIRDIGRTIASAGMLMSVRQEVAKVMKSGFVVTDGKHHVAGRGYDVVVACEGSQDGVARRLRASMSELKVDEITAGVLGIKTARRVRKLEM